MLDEIRRLIVEDLSDDVTLPLPSDQWMEAKDKATISVHCCLNRVCVVKSIDSDETIDTVKLHESFRAAMHPQTHILYKWICLCATGMEKGFCAHCFLWNITNMMFNIIQRRSQNRLTKEVCLRCHRIIAPSFEGVARRIP